MADREDERVGLTGMLYAIHPSQCFPHSAISQEEKLQYRMQEILDNELFTPKSLFGRTLPTVLRLIKRQKFVSQAVQEDAMLCLAKLMLVKQAIHTLPFD